MSTFLTNNIQSILIICGVVMFDDFTANTKLANSGPLVLEKIQD